MMAELTSRRWLTSLIRVVAVPAVFAGSLSLVPAAEAALKHQYLFSTDAPALGTFADSVGGATGTLFGTATVSGGRLQLPGGGAGITGDHAQLSTALGTGVNAWTYSAISTSTWASTDNINDLWARYFDIGFRNVPDNNAPNDSAANSIYATIDAPGNLPMSTTEIGIRQSISNVASTPDTGGAAGSSAEQHVFANIRPLSGQFHHLVTTFDTNTDIGRVYFNGVLVGENTMMTHSLAVLDFMPVAPQLERINYALLGGSLYGDPSFDGYISQFEIYDHALTQAEVTALAAAPPAGEGSSRLQVNRTTGELTLLRDFASQSNVVGYSITSAAGSLNYAKWNPIADNYDDGAVGGVDDETWTKLTDPDSPFDLSEFNFDDGNGGTLATTITLGDAGDGTLADPGAWRRSIYQDVQMTLKLADGTDVVVAVEYTGTAPMRSDFDLDNDIDLDDYEIFVTNHGRDDLTTMGDAESYLLGDISGNQVINLTDFRTFKTDYVAFQSMLGGGVALPGGQVPEPTSLALLGMALSGIGLMRRRNGRRSAESVSQSTQPAKRGLQAACLVLAVVAMGLFSADASADVIHRYTFNNAAGLAADMAVVEDIVGDKDGQVRWAGAPELQPAFTGTSLRLQAGGNNDNANPPANDMAVGGYVDLPNGMISAITTDATFEFWYTVRGDSNWSRVFDFGDSNGEVAGPAVEVPAGAGDSFFYAAQRGTNEDQQRTGFENEIATCGGVGCVELATGQFFNDPNVVVGLNNLVHGVVVVDRDGGAGGTMQLRTYIQGVLRTSGNDTEVGAQLEQLNDVNNWLGRSNYNGDNHLNGELHEFRIYNNNLTAADISRNAFLGPEFDPNVTGSLPTLEVNTVTGQVSIKNNLSLALPALDYYEITSPMGAINVAGWNSLDDKESGDPLGTGWDETGNPDVNGISEFFLDPAGFGSFAGNSSLSLGAAFNPAIFGSGVDGDLVFQLTTASGVTLNATVVYDDTPGGLTRAGDYNGDGTVNAADYTVYRNRKAGIGGTTLPANADDTPGIAADDYLRWKANYGNAYPGSGSSVGGSDVPEPTTLLSLVFGLAVAGLAGGRRRSVR